MPAITTDKISSLRKIQRPDETAIVKPVIQVSTAPSGFEGEGFPVRRAFSLLPQNSVDPFIMMDQMGEVEYEVGEAKGTPWHPHRGFETVTYLIDGTFEHRDSNGGGGLISDGDTQWMTAGAGILHIEAPTEEAVLKGGLFHGVQVWVNLPASMKWSNPRYQDIHGAKLKLLSSHDGGSLIRVIAGEVDGNKGPGNTYTPICIVHASVSPDSSIEIPWDPGFNALGYVLAGNGYAGEERVAVHSGQAIVFGSGDSLNITASKIQDSRSEELEILFLGGQPIREPIAWHGPFVMNSREELQQAFHDYQTGRLGIVPALDYVPHGSSPSIDGKNR